MSFIRKWLYAHTGLSNHVNKTNFIFSRPSCIYPTYSIYDDFMLTLSRCKEEDCPRPITCSGSFYGCGQGCCRFSNTSWCCCEMMPSSFECTKAVADHFKLTGSSFFVSKVRDSTSLNSVFRLTHIVRTMTTPLKDSVESLRYLESVVSQSGVYDTCGVSCRQETGVESLSPRPSSGRLWGSWCWGPRRPSCARRARTRKLAKPCKFDRPCTSLKEAFGSVLSSSCQIIPSPLCSHRFFYWWYSLRFMVASRV